MRKTLKPPASYPDKASLGKMKKTKSLELEMLCFDINEDETEILFCCQDKSSSGYSLKVYDRTKDEIKSE